MNRGWIHICVKKRRILIASLQCVNLSTQRKKRTIWFTTTFNDKWMQKKHIPLDMYHVLTIVAHKYCIWKRCFLLLWSLISDMCNKVFFGIFFHLFFSISNKFIVLAPCHDRYMFSKCCQNIWHVKSINCILMQFIVRTKILQRKKFDFFCLLFLLPLMCYYILHVEKRK